MYKIHTTYQLIDNWIWDIDNEYGIGVPLVRFDHKPLVIDTSYHKNDQYGLQFHRDLVVLFENGREGLFQVDPFTLLEMVPSTRTGKFLQSAQIPRLILV